MTSTCYEPSTDAIDWAAITDRPTSFAVHCSGGKWRRAKHLSLISDTILDTIDDPSLPRIIVVQCPPRHGKSEFISRWFLAWYRATFPDNNVILTAYEQNFAKRWGRKVRDILEEHGHLFGITVRRDNRSISEWSIDGHEDGSMQCAGAGGALVGKGAHLLVIDDPIKNAEEGTSALQLENLWDWWQSTASTRLEPNGIAIIIQQRWHEDDLSGKLIKSAKSGEGDPITLIDLPAIGQEGDADQFRCEKINYVGREAAGLKPDDPLWEMRFPRAKLDQIKNSKSIYWWNAQYRQRPTQPEGAEWSEEHFPESMLVKPELWPDSFDMEVVTLDPSKGKTDKSDFSALIRLGLRGGKLWVAANIKRRPVTQMVNEAFGFCYGRPLLGFGIEGNAWQDLLANEFDRVCREMNLMPLPIHLIDNRVNKEVRIRRIGPYLTRKQIRILDNADGRLLVKQMKEFPLGDHDDGPDSLEMAIRLMADISRAAVQEQVDSECEVAHV